MPRPRTTSDDAILAAAFKVISRLGLANATLADVAREVNLSPATLMQRFGSKRGLLLALAKMGVDSVDDCFAAVRAEHKSPLATLIAAATFMARHTTSPEELANGLAFLQMYVSDPEFHRLALENSTRILAGYRTLIKAAIAERELIPCNPTSLARAVNATAAGSLISWAIHRQGKAMKWVESDLAALLVRYRVKKGKKAR